MCPNSRPSLTTGGPCAMKRPGVLRFSVLAQGVKPGYHPAMPEDFFADQPTPEDIEDRMAGFGGWFEIDLDCLGHNLAEIRKRTGVEVMPVIKNDAYGHGLIPIAAALAGEGVKWLMVAKTVEALAIKDRLPDCQVVNMDALYTDAQAREVVKRGIAQVIYTHEGAARLSRAAKTLGRKAGVFVKIDTGLHRIGVPSEEAVAYMETLDADPDLEIRGTFATFMQEREQDEAMFARFQGVLDGLAVKGIDPGLRSMASSYAVFHYPHTWLDMVRPAMSLFGIYTEPREREAGMDLRQCLTFKGRVEHIKWVEAGQSVTYSGRFTTPERMRIATLHLGFYDAIPRELTNKARIRIGDTLKTSLGSISLNHMLFDATGISLEVGDVVEVYSREGENDLAHIAEGAGWMVYSVLNHLNPTLPRVYTRGGKSVALLERSVA